ncbi:MAG TPA: hypothetical protein VFH47_03465, partial [Candidatus Thermoplasmatota archaeon]|nr:hypothetical protein [Candidatus Thermoplasmatota archaeon]
AAAVGNGETWRSRGGAGFPAGGRPPAAMRAGEHLREGERRGGPGGKQELQLRGVQGVGADADGRLAFEEMVAALGLAHVDAGPTLDADADYHVHLRLVPRLPADARLDGRVRYVAPQCPPTGTHAGEQAILDTVLLIPSACEAPGSGASCPAPTQAIVFGSGTMTSRLETPCPTDVAAFLRGGGTVVAIRPATRLDADWVASLLRPSSSRPLQEPDPSHPLLTTPHRLDGALRAAPGAVDPFGAAEADLRAHTVQRVLGPPEHPVLLTTTGGAIRSDAAATAGRILALLADPLDPTDDDDPAREALRGRHALQNLLARHHEHVFLDYGHPIGPEARPAVHPVLVAAPAEGFRTPGLADACGAPECLQADLLVYLSRTAG